MMPFYALNIATHQLRFPQRRLVYQTEVLQQHLQQDVVVIMLIQQADCVAQHRQLLQRSEQLQPEFYAEVNIVLLAKRVSIRIQASMFVAV